jgi:hypothetical protein
VASVDPEAAGRELAHRHLGAYGSSSPAELGHWTGTTAAQGRAWLALLDPDGLVDADVEGTALVCLAAHAAALAEAEALPPAPCASCRPTTSTRSAPRRTPRRRSRLRVELAPWAPLGVDASAAAEGEAERLAAFLGGEPEIAWAS